jgi:hypothetical protein
MEPLEEINEADWQESERFWIAYLKFLGFKLTNIEAGGFGGCSRTPITKRKISLALAGVPKSESHRVKLSKALAGKPLTKAALAWRKGHKHTPEFGAARSEMMKRVWKDRRSAGIYSVHTKAAKRRMSVAQKKRFNKTKGKQYGEGMVGKGVGLHQG